MNNNRAKKQSTLWQQVEKDFLTEFRHIFPHQYDREWLHRVAVLLDKAIDDNIEFGAVTERLLSEGKEECNRQLTAVGVDLGAEIGENDKITTFAITRAVVLQAAFFWWFYAYGRNRVASEMRSRN